MQIVTVSLGNSPPNPLSSQKHALEHYYIYILIYIVVMHYFRVGNVPPVTCIFGHTHELANLQRALVIRDKLDRQMRV